MVELNFFITVKLIRINDDLKIAGGTGITTAISGDTLTITASGGSVTASSTTTFTNKTIDQDGTGNSITNIANAKKSTQTQPKTEPEPKKSSPAPQQKVATGNDGQRYTHYGLQWINDKTGRIATRDVAAHLDQNIHLQTPISV